MMPTSFDYDDWFQRVTGHEQPWLWQHALACPELSDAPNNQFIRIPTGLGKTEGVLCAWAWNRLVLNNEEWPRRLVWCLPMRVLVEQTIATASALLEKIGTPHPVEVHPLMGGADAGDWRINPEYPAVLVGTQDMLLSRALNRGYGSARGRWPMEYGLLHTDCLWVMDEVQLMDVGLITSVQLQAFRNGSDPFRPRHSITWWMSATLQTNWFHTADSQTWVPGLEENIQTAREDLSSKTLSETEKPVRVFRIPAKTDKDQKNLAACVVEAHLTHSFWEQPNVTLVIVNRVDTACTLHEAIDRLLKTMPDGPVLRLVHGRYRGLERSTWSSEFLSKRHSLDPKTNTIIIATQVVEAGVDISASTLITELAPWPSLIQRFGRAARYGGAADILVIDRDLDDKNSMPYCKKDLTKSRAALDKIDDVSVDALEIFEQQIKEISPEFLSDLYPYNPPHVLTARESRELFDTSPDLTGSDIDISRFIRTGDERDVSVCWIDGEWDHKERRSPSPEVQPLRAGLCPVPVYDARKWLFDKSRLKEGCHAWVWSYTDGEWRTINVDDCYPGQTILVDAKWGGYDSVLGFTGIKANKKESSINTNGSLRSSERDDDSDLAQARDDRSRHQWKTIASHAIEAAEAVKRLSSSLGLPMNMIDLLSFAARLHDWGKSHPAFQTSIQRDGEAAVQSRLDLAKAPGAAWIAPNRLYQLDPEIGPRRGFRHELASVLAMFELLRSIDPNHEALLGNYGDLIKAGVLNSCPNTPSEARTKLGTELAALSSDSFDLLAYLVCAHHGKVRVSWQATPHDQKFPIFNKSLTGTGQPLCGVRRGDTLPELSLPDATGQPIPVPSVHLNLEPAAVGLSSAYGSSWRERVELLLDRYGPFTLAYLETLVRVADVRASQLNTPDPLLPETTP